MDNTKKFEKRGSLKLAQAEKVYPSFDGDDEIQPKSIQKMIDRGPKMKEEKKENDSK